MCGIAGFYPYAEERRSDPHTLVNMLRVLNHRGPDDHGTHHDDLLAMGTQRLSIIDVATGHQPIYNEDRSVVVVCNGEIYNYEQLTSRLKGRGHVFRTESDTEVIVHLYEEMGEECVHELRGMFAFAVWDIRARRLFIARDRLGIKPLYYRDDGRQLIFASEIKAILQHPQVTPELDLNALGHYLSLRYVPAPLTMFSEIRSLCPGHQLTCSSLGSSPRRYWDLEFNGSFERVRCEEDYLAELDHLLRETIKLHLRSDVPFGAFLSGGMDSSLIVALMSEIVDRPVKTFSVGFDMNGGCRDELPYARIVADRYDTEHREITMKPSDFEDLAEKVTWHLDQPLADQATVATYMLSLLAKQSVKVVLSGEGADELFAGYARYSGERLWPLFRFAPDSVKSLALRTSRRLRGLRKTKLALYALCQRDEPSRLINWFPLFNSDMRNGIASAAVRDQLFSSPTEALVEARLRQCSTAAPLNRMLYFDSKLWLPDLLLQRGDKMCMAASVEARVPLLDHRVAEFAARLPVRLKLRGLTRKYLLRKIADRRLPRAIVRRRKQGFPIPISRWFRGQLRTFVHDLLSESGINARGLLDADFVGKLMREHDRGACDHGLLLWGIMSVELWHRVFLDGADQRRRAPGVDTIEVARSDSHEN